jgi:sulfatase modifying factor 1
MLRNIIVQTISVIAIATADEPECGCAASRSTAEPSTTTNLVEGSHAASVPRGLFNAPSRLQFDDNEIVRIPAGSSTLGTDSPHFPQDGESPSYPTTIPRDFWMDMFEVSNRRFARFVEETSFKTEAEDYGWSFVHELAVPAATLALITQSVKDLEWWLPV